MLLIYLFTNGIHSEKSSFFWIKFNVDKGNQLNFNKSRFEQVGISVEGCQNEIRCYNSLISRSSIQINGTNNKLHLESGVKLRGAKINIRGNNNCIFIGRNSTFGGVRMGNDGQSNSIKIGENCLFADFIEIWASDTHSIYNKNGEVINREKPIEIGDRVWIGSHVIILKGVHIHHGSVIGMGSLVTKDVPPNVISAGRPNTVIKEQINWTLDYLI